MHTFWDFMNRMNIWAWIGGAIVVHLLLYFFMGTRNWAAVGLLAGGTWAVAFIVLKAIGRAMNRERT